MDPMFSMIFAVIGTLLTLMLGIIGFFIKKLIEGIDRLKSSVDKLEIVVAIEKNKLSTFDRNCQLIHGRVDTRLSDHAKRILTNEKDISNIKTKLEK